MQITKRYKDADGRDVIEYIDRDGHRHRRTRDDVNMEIGDIDLDLVAKLFPEEDPDGPKAA